MAIDDEKNSGTFLPPTAPSSWFLPLLLLLLFSSPPSPFFCRGFAPIGRYNNDERSRRVVSRRRRHGVGRGIGIGVDPPSSATTTTTAVAAARRAPLRQRRSRQFLQLQRLQLPEPIATRSAAAAGCGWRASSSSPRQQQLLASSSTAVSAANTNDDDGDDQVVVVGGDVVALSEQQRRRRKRVRDASVLAVLCSAFLNLLGFTMAGPITPALGRHFGLQVGVRFGSLTSAYPLGMLLGLFTWPQLSDNRAFGRKKVMAVSLLGSGLGLCAQALVVSRGLSLRVFLLSRALTGAFAGSSPVSKAYLADIGDESQQLPRYLAWRDAACTAAFIIGPMLGGVMYDIRCRIVGSGGGGSRGAAAVVPKVAAVWRKVVRISTGRASSSSSLDPSMSLAFVIGVSAVASLAATFLVLAFVEDYKPRRRTDKKSDLKKETVDGKEESFVVVETTTADGDDNNGYVYEEKLVSCPLGTAMWAGVASVCLVSFLFNVGDSTFHAFFSALLRDRAGLNPTDIGLLYTMLACVSFTVSATFVSRILKTFGPVATCAGGLSCIGAGLLALGAAASNAGVPSLLGGGMVSVAPTFGVLAGAAALYYCGVPLYGPTSMYLSRCVAFCCAPSSVARCMF